MNSENDLSADLNNIMTDFNKFKQVNEDFICIMHFCLVIDIVVLILSTHFQFYLREQMLRHKFEGVSRNLQEENKVIRNLEKSERDKLNTSREFTLQQQNIISDLLVVESMQTDIRSLSICN
jgi:beta-lactamase regulating signal transducer with metallopeptidase domain